MYITFVLSIYIAVVVVPRMCPTQTSCNQSAMVHTMSDAAQQVPWKKSNKLLQQQKKAN